MVFDYSRLKGRIVEKYDCQSAFAKAVNIPISTLSQKITQKYSFTQNEIYRISSKLGLSNSEIGDYFFTTTVRK